jgi:hypothetical protein
MEPLRLSHQGAWSTVSALMLGLAGMAAGACLRDEPRAQVRASVPQDSRRVPPETIYVDSMRGSDDSPGTAERPLKSISAALVLLPDPLPRSVTIELTSGHHETTGGNGMPLNTLELMRRMRPGVTVMLIGREGRADALPILAWKGGRAMVDIREGDWRLENLQIGSGSTQQRRGVMVTGPGHATLKNVTFRTRSLSDAGIYAERGGKVSLCGAIRLNEHLHNEAPEESFCGIIATDHGLVRFVEREGASLDMGNGSLSASYYGCIRLGGATARITSWSEQSNNLAINNGGRIDLHGTPVVLRAKQKRNTPIGLEHDGHILGEDARVVIEGENNMAIALQKASTFTCNDIELRGRFEYCLWASSGSTFVGGFVSDVGRIEATTGASINVEKISGKLEGPVVAKRCGTISLPDRNVFSE